MVVPVKRYELLLPIVSVVVPAAVATDVTPTNELLNDRFLFASHSAKVDAVFVELYASADDGAAVLPDVLANTLFAAIVANPIVPDVVIVPPVNPALVEIDVTVPVPVGVPHEGADEVVAAKNCPVVPLANLVSIPLLLR